MEPIGKFEKILAHNKLGIYYPHPDDLGSEIFIPLQTEIRDFLKRNLHFFELDNLEFYCINSESINGCAVCCDNTNFIGLSRGLFFFGFLIISDIFKENTFLYDFLGESNEQPITIGSTQFLTIGNFLKENKIVWNSIGIHPSNPIRKEIAKSVFEYFVFFVLMHEIGHLRQKNRKNIVEFDNENKNDEPYLISQVYESDADLYAVNKFAIRLMSIFDKKNDKDKSIFFHSKETVCYFSIFIPLLLFYIFSHNKNFIKYTLAYDHPHPALRLKYTMDVLVTVYTENQFLEKAAIDSIGTRVISDFFKIMKIIFPDSDVLQYFNLILDAELRHHAFILESVSKQMSDLKSYHLNRDWY